MIILSINFLSYLFYFIFIFFNYFFFKLLDEIIFKHLFYLRFILFTFAIVDLLKENKNLILLFCQILIVTILVVSLDGIFQFIFGYNILGFEKVRVDRLSGFFDDKMILGSYLSRLFPLMVALLIYNYNYLSKFFLIFGVNYNFNFFYYNSFVW